MKKCFTFLLLLLILFSLTACGVSEKTASEAVQAIRQLDLASSEDIALLEEKYSNFYSNDTFVDAILQEVSDPSKDPIPFFLNLTAIGFENNTVSDQFEKSVVAQWEVLDIQSLNLQSFDTDLTLLSATYQSPAIKEAAHNLLNEIQNRLMDGRIPIYDYLNAFDLHLDNYYFSVMDIFPDTLFTSLAKQSCEKVIVFDEMGGYYDSKKEEYLNTSSFHDPLGAGSKSGDVGTYTESVTYRFCGDFLVERYSKYWAQTDKNDTNNSYSSNLEFKGEYLSGDKDTIENFLSLVSTGFSTYYCRSNDDKATFIIFHSDKIAFFNDGFLFAVNYTAPSPDGSSSDYLDFLYQEAKELLNAGDSSSVLWMLAELAELGHEQSVQEINNNCIALPVKIETQSATTSLLYNSTGQLIEEHYTAKNSRPATTVYSYDDDGNLKEKTVTYTLTDGRTDETQTFIFNEDGRTVDVFISEINPDKNYHYQDTYTYDEQGNVLTTTRVDMDTGETKYTWSYTYVFSESGDILTKTLDSKTKYTRSSTVYEYTYNSEHQILYVDVTNGNLTYREEYTYEYFYLSDE